MAVRFNINNPDSCQRAYLNYHCYGNTMNISPSDMGAILARWGDKVESWEKSATTNDSVDYEFDNSDFEKYKDQYGDDVNIGVEHGRGTLDLGVAATGIILRKTAEKTFEKSGEKVAGWALERAGNKAAKKAVKKATQEQIEKAGEKALIEQAKNTPRGVHVTKDKLSEAGKKAIGDEAASEATTEVTAESGAQSIGCIIGCVMAAATATTYWVKRPNKEEVKIVNELNEKMGTAQTNLVTEQETMAKTQEEIVTLVGEAEIANEEANSFIAEQEASQQFTLTTINSIKAKQESGARLTASERSLFKDNVKLLNESNVAQNTASTDTQDEVASLYSEIEGKQTVYDTTADTMSDIQGMTEYAESMDTATAFSCGIEAVAQGLNTVSGYKSAGEATALATSGSWAFGATAWAYAFAAMGYAAAAASALGAAEQVKNTIDVTKEISNRNNTQDLNSSTQEIYNQEVDALAGSLGYIEDLEYEIPELNDTSGMVLAADKPEEPEEELKKKTEDETI